jgi:hypothetical protein
MNHTIRSIIIVVAITSMLVVGATSMIPITQNSLAHKKSDFKQAERDPNTNTNTNTNTNSADSSSSSDATADNTNNINNTATSAQSQEQDACAVALTCPEGSTTVTATPPPPPMTGTLEISKVCDPSCPDSTFSITVTDNNPQPSSFNLNNGDTQSVTLGSGSFTVHEDSSGFTPTFSGDCKQTEPGSEDATGTISAGQTLHCTITNTPPPTTGTLTISKDCPDLCPGTTFSITITGNNPDPSSFTLGNRQSQVVTLGPGSFTVTETPVTGFQQLFIPSSTCKQTGPFSNSATGTISAGQNLECDIVNEANG